MRRNKDQIIAALETILEEIDYLTTTTKNDEFEDAYQSVREGKNILEHIGDEITKGNKLKTSKLCNCGMNPGFHERQLNCR